MADLLIVDDDKDSRDALCAFLKAANHDVRGVSNGKEALHAVLERTPDLLILDLIHAGNGWTQFLRDHSFIP